jgi:hypothetical protein
MIPMSLLLAPTDCMNAHYLLGYFFLSAFSLVLLGLLHASHPRNSVNDSGSS